MDCSVGDVVRLNDKRIVEIGAMNYFYVFDKAGQIICNINEISHLYSDEIETKAKFLMTSKELDILAYTVLKQTWNCNDDTIQGLIVKELLYMINNIIVDFKVALEEHKKEDSIR